MKGKWFSIAGLTAAAVVLLSQPSCARSQQLVAITVNPPSTSITQNPGEQVQTQFTALGTYIHPPETKDVTKTAVWAVDSPQILEVVPGTPGLIETTGNGCGTNLGVSASVYTDDNNPSGNVVVGLATISVTFGSGCP
jgi:hypothetical protein